MYTPNPITAFDFYKADHRRQYPDGTDMVYSNFTPRSDRLANVIHDQWEGKIVFAGLQALLIQFFVREFNEKFFSQPKEKVVKAFARRMLTSLGPNNIGTKHIEALHDLGYLPIHIKALPEGSRVPMKVPVLTVKNTHPDFFWLTNAFETVLSLGLWKACTSATIAKEYRKMLDRYAAITGTDPAFVDWQGHNFSMRGMSGMDDAVVVDFGHLLSFFGTDTIPGIDFAEEYYGADAEKEMIGGSVAATEHSVMCMGMQDGEVETFRRLIEDIYPEGIVSIVSDTWDFWKVMTEIAPSLKDKIMARNGKVVFRPDSGDPVKILTGYRVAESLVAAKDAYYEDYTHVFEAAYVYGKIYKIEPDYWHSGDFYEYRVKDEISEAEAKGAVQVLWETFGGTETSTGYKMLDSHVGLIYGDSITLERAKAILERLEAKGFASGNVVFGIGSYTYEYVTRDTFGFAMKATAGSVNGGLREIFKDPATDSGTKKSAKGLLRVEFENGSYVLYDQQTPEQEEQGCLQTVFKDGKMFNVQTLAEIRQRLKNQ